MTEEGWAKEAAILLRITSTGLFDLNSPEQSEGANQGNYMEASRRKFVQRL